MRSALNCCFLEHLYLAVKIGCYIFDSGDERTDYIGDEANDKFHPGTDLVRKMRALCLPGKGPVLDVEENLFVYGAFLDGEDNLYLFGIMALREPGVKDMFRFQKTYGISLSEIEIPVRSYEDMVNVLALAYMQVNREPVSDHDILTNGQRERSSSITEADLSDYQVGRSFGERERHGQSMEAEHYGAVARGDVEYFEKHINHSSGSLEKVGDMAKDNRKKVEYMFVTTLALTRAAAVNGGMKYWESCDLSDLYLQKLERCGSEEEILGLLENMRLDYTRRVRKIKMSEKKNQYIEFCKDYIAQGITKPFQVKQLAELLGLNPDYLSKMFSEQEGMTLTEYRIKAKLNAARNQLKYSEYSITAISEYFSFSSPSRFSSYFKKEYGMTPMQYRRENQVLEFIEKK